MANPKYIRCNNGDWNTIANNPTISTTIPNINNEPPIIVKSDVVVKAYSVSAHVTASVRIAAANTN